jgi:integrase
MAFVTRYKNCKYWIAGFRDSNGKQHRRSTREVDRRRALAVAQKYERVAQRKGSAQRVKQTIAEFYRVHYGQEMPAASVRAYCESWLAAREAETAASTHRRYSDGIQGFLAFLGDRAGNGIDEVTPQQITAYRDALLGRLAPATVNSYLKIIRRIFRTARRDRYVLEDPAENVGTVRDRAERTRRPFTIDELRAVLRVADPEWQSLVKFGLYSGQRLGDLCALTWNAIDLERGELRIRTRKTGRSLIIPLAEPLREHILSLPASDNPRAPVHPRSFATLQAQEGRVGMLSRQFGEILTDAGLRDPQPHVSRGIGRNARRRGLELSFHSLRHSAVTWLKAAGVADATVMALIGHESLLMSGHYTHIGRAELSRAVTSLPEI